MTNASVGGETNAGATANSIGQLATTVADAVALPLARPSAVALDPARRQRFTADADNGVVRATDEATGLSAILAGNPASTATPGATPVDAKSVSLGRPSGLAFDATGYELFVADEARGQILRITFGPGNLNLIRVIAGDASLKRPGNLAFHRFANGQRVLFVAEQGVEGSTATARQEPLLRVLDLGSLAFGTIVPQVTFEPLTTTAFAATGSLPTSTIPVASTSLFAPTGSITIALGPTNQQVVNYTSTTSSPPAFLGCTGGTGPLGPNLVVRGKGTAGLEIRRVADLALRPVADGGAELFVVADVAEVVGDGIGVNLPGPYEVDLYNGIDDDFDGQRDFADADAQRPMYVNVLRLQFPATGLAVTNGPPVSRATTRHLRCFRRFEVGSVVHDPFCASVPPGFVTTASTFPDGAFQSLCVDAAGRMFLMDAIRGEVRFVELDANNALVRTGVVAGTLFQFASPFDGGDPRLTRLNRPLDLQIDGLGNLYVVDAADNRVRRMWIGDSLGN